MYVRQDGLAAVCVTDGEYLQRVAFTMLTRVLDDFASKVPTMQWVCCNLHICNAKNGRWRIDECEFIGGDQEREGLSVHGIAGVVNQMAESPRGGRDDSSAGLSFPRIPFLHCLALQEEVEETKVVLHNTIQSVLERGEKLDDLVEKSESLSAQSKLFYTQARKMNKCCNWV